MESVVGVSHHHVCWLFFVVVWVEYLVSGFMMTHPHCRLRREKDSLATTVPLLIEPCGCRRVLFEALALRFALFGLNFEAFVAWRVHSCCECVSEIWGSN